MGRGFDPRWGHKETLQSGVSSHLYDSRSVVILSENAVTMSPTPARKRVIIFTCSTGHPETCSASSSLTRK